MIGQPGASDEPRGTDRIGAWQRINDDLYSGEVRAHPDSRFAGWYSSYTGEPIPLPEMLEWRDVTVRRVGRLRPRRVLEIGVGSGLLLTALAGQCDSYWGIDISDVALDWLDDTLPDDIADRVVLRRRAAHELEDIPDSYFDTVIMNSVVQYFPDIGYLRRTLDHVFRLLVSDGSVFVGDVRNPRLQRGLLAAVTYRRTAGNVASAEFHDRVDRAMRLDTELLVDPDFFTSLPYAADIRIKRGVHHNELTRHRYDVILQPGRPYRVPRPALRLEWGSDVAALRDLGVRLAERSIGELLVTRIPNLRLAEENLTLATMDSQPTGRDGVEPERLFELGAAMGYQVLATWSAVDNDGRFDVLFTTEHGVAAPYPVTAVQDAPAENDRREPLRGPHGPPCRSP